MATAAPPTLEQMIDPKNPKFLIVGECGDGKSTLINAVAQAAAKAGRDPRGVTKELNYYFMKDMQGIVIDTPGVGDHDVNFVLLLKLVAEALTRFEVHGVVVCSKDYARVKLGGQMVSQLVNAGFKSKAKWDSVVFVWTHGDKADDGDRAYIHSAVEACMTQLGVTASPRVCVTSCPANGPHDTKDLMDHLKSVAQNAGIGEFKAPSDAEIAKVISDATGVDFNDTMKQLQEIQAQLVKQQEEHRRELEKLQQNFSAEMEKARERHDKTMASMQGAHQQALQQMQKDGQANLNAILKQQADERREREAAYATERRAMEERISKLQTPPAIIHRGGGCSVM